MIPQGFQQRNHGKGVPKKPNGSPRGIPRDSKNGIMGAPGIPRHINHESNAKDSTDP